MTAHNRCKVSPTAWVEVAVQVDPSGFGVFGRDVCVMKLVHLDRYLVEVPRESVQLDGVVIDDRSGALLVKIGDCVSSSPMRSHRSRSGGAINVVSQSMVRRAGRPGD
jgi:hypothetical protein